MTDIRLKKTPFEFDGKTFELCSNMNVLADVQEAYGGSISEALNGTVRSALTFLAAMLNDYAESVGWEEHYTSRDVGRALSPLQLSELTSIVMSLVTESLKGDDEPEPETAEGDEAKN